MERICALSAGPAPPMMKPLLWNSARISSSIAAVGGPAGSVGRRGAAARWSVGWGFGDDIYNTYMNMSLSIHIAWAAGR